MSPPPNKQPDGYIPLSAGALEPLRLVTDEDMKEMQGKHDAQMDRMTTLMGAVILVLFIGFITLLFSLAGLLLDNWRFHSESYKNYMETIRSQGNLMENDQNELREEIRQLKIEIQTLKAPPRN